MQPKDQYSEGESKSADGGQDEIATVRSAGFQEVGVIGWWAFEG